MFFIFQNQAQTHSKYFPNSCNFPKTFTKLSFKKKYHGFNPKYEWTSHIIFLNKLVLISNVV